MNAVELEVFRHVYASIAEEMGATLMRSAFSPNIKERRDFSCAVFDADAGMVAQAAHIPVHLGSTPLSVRAALAAVDAWDADTHIMLNDPYAGGTHLPDLTLVSPVFNPVGELCFFVANRAHHADVGGITPGSLPLSRHIEEEGIRISPTRWSDELRLQIMDASRTPDERDGDLRAQLAANLRGRARLEEWVGRPGFIDAATQLQDYSERFMRQVLAELPDGSWTFDDVLDDDGFGTTNIPIRCVVTISGRQATVDLRGSAGAVEGPLNVPFAVTLSAVLYAFRCLAPAELPTNAGYMRCIEVLTDPGSLLDARMPSPVAVGNTETSQRIADVVFGALAQAAPDRVPAASCGTMNNLTVGGEGSNGSYAYYETIGGGGGAGASWDGPSGHHTHMTNTLNTPVEAFEHAYPMRMVSYAIRDGSGGAGAHRGGDGVVRHYRFEGAATVTLMTERRENAPYGLAGGAPGKPGRNTLIRNGKPKALPGKCTVELRAGDELRVETPGGGGHGIPD